MNEERFDVVGVRIKTNVVRVMAKHKSEENAEAYVSIVVARRGVDEEFFAAVPEGSFSDGDLWDGSPRGVLAL